MTENSKHYGADRNLSLTTHMEIENIEKIIQETTEYEESGNYEKALLLYDSLLENFPDKPRFWALRGYCNYHRKAYSDALKDFTQALLLKSDVATTLHYRARTYEKFDRLDEALVDYKKSAELLPMSDVFLDIGMIYEYRKEFEVAKKYYLMAKKLDPEDEFIKRRMRIVYRNISKNNKSLKK